MAVAAPEVRPETRSNTRPSPPAPRRRQRRSLSERLTLNVVVGLIAALLAFVLAASLLADRRETITVAVASEPIPAGASITPDVVRGEAVGAETPFAASLVPLAEVADGGLVAARTIQPGEPIAASAVGTATSNSGRRVMSMSLEPWQAANGELEVGDRVDIVASADGQSRYVLTDASVVGRSGGVESGGLVGGSRSGELVLLVEVDGAQALKLAAAIDGGTIMVVRATGAEPLPPSLMETAP